MLASLPNTDVSKRIGIARDFVVVPDNIDNINDEVALIFITKIYHDIVEYGEAAESFEESFPGLYPSRKLFPFSEPYNVSSKNDSRS